MGRYENLAYFGKEDGLRLRAPMTVIATSEHLDALSVANGATLLDDARLVPLGPQENVSEAHLSGAGVLVLQVDPHIPASMARIEQVRAIRPDLPQIVALDSADIAMVRMLLHEGVADVVALPLNPEEMLQAAVTVFEKRAHTDPVAIELAPIVAVTRALGGAGATTLATHLATSFADEGASVCLFDLDIQFGRAAEVLGIQPRRTLADLLEAADRLDASFLRSVAAQHSSGLTVFAAPPDIIPLESVDSSQLHKILDIACNEYEFVFLDMPSNLTNWGLSVLTRASSIVMVTEQNIASLRQAKRRLDLFGSVGIGKEAVSVVVNRMERRLFGSISLGDVEEALDRQVIEGLRSEGQNIAIAQDQGLLLGQMRSKSTYTAGIASLTETLKQSLRKGSHG